MTVQAYVLIQTEVGKAAQVASEVRKIEGVKCADDVTGPYDVIVNAEADSVDELGRRLQLGRVVEVLVLVGVEVGAGDDLAGERRLRRPVAQYGDLDLPAGDPLLDEDPLVVTEGDLERLLQAGPVGGLRHADRR